MKAISPEVVDKVKEVFDTLDWVQGKMFAMKSEAPYNYTGCCLWGAMQLARGTHNITDKDYQLLRWYLLENLVGGIVGFNDQTAKSLDDVLRMLDQVKQNLEKPEVQAHLHDIWVGEML